MRLQLDGAYFLHKVADDYGYGQSQNRVNSLKKHVWSRLTFLAQAILALVHAVVVQTLRAISSFISGILTLQGKRIRDAGIDVLSILIQVIALPILGIVGTFLPKTVFDLCPYTLLKNPKDNAESYSSPCCYRLIDHEITGFVHGIFGCPSGIVSGTISIVSGLIALRSLRIKHGIKIVAHGFLSPVWGIISGCSHPSFRNAIRIHQSHKQHKLMLAFS